MNDDKGISYEELQRLNAEILKLAEKVQQIDDRYDQYMDLGKYFGWRAKLRGKIMGYKARIYWFLWELRRR